MWKDSTLINSKPSINKRFISVFYYNSWMVQQLPRQLSKPFKWYIKDGILLLKGNFLSNYNSIYSRDEMKDKNLLEFPPSIFYENGLN
jgi:hypothetical protein